MDWAKLMENFIFACLFFMSMMFLYVIFGFDIPVIVILSLIYLNLRDKYD